MRDTKINEMFIEDLKEYACFIKALYSGKFELTQDFITDIWDVYDVHNGMELGLKTEKDLINFCLKSKSIDNCLSIKIELEDRMDYLTDYKYSLYLED